MIQIIFLILFLFIFLIYSKSNREYFIIDKLNIKFDRNNEILWLCKDLINIEKSNFSTLFKKYNYPYYSNSIINSNTIKNGIIFKPNKDCKNMFIGLSNLKNENKEKIIQNELLDFGFDLLGNNLVKVIEKVEIENEKKYLFQDLDYCNDPNIDKCMKSNNTYQYQNGDMLALIFHNNLIHYLIITKETGILIHKSKNMVNLPLNAIMINNENDNILEEYYFTSNDYNIKEDTIWSVELLPKIKYNQEDLPKLSNLGRPGEPVVEKPIEKPNENQFEIPKFERAIRIKDANIDKNNILNINSQIYNMNQKTLNTMYSIKVIITPFDENKKNNKSLNNNNDKSLNFDILNDNISKEIFNMDSNNKLGTIQLKLSDYVNIIYNKKLKIQLVLRRTDSTSDDLNYVSNEFIL